MDNLRVIAKNVISALGGVRSAALQLGVSPSAVSRWSQIPHRHLHRIYEILGDGYEPEKIRPDLAKLFHAHSGHDKVSKSDFKIEELP